MEITQKRKNKNIAKTISGGEKQVVMEFIKKNQKDLTILKEFVSDLDTKLDALCKKARFLSQCRKRTE